MANYLIGTDVGTGGTKSVLIDEEGKVLGSAYIEYGLITKRPGWAEQDPEWYWNAVADTIQQCISQSGVEPEQIRGVSISALAPACILVDKDLRPLQNAHIWMDRRGTAEAQWIRENIGDARAAEKSGNPIDPYFASVKLLWEKNNRPDLYKKTYKIQTAADYPVMKLTGKAVTDYSNASLFGVGYDIVNKTWDEEMIEKLGLDIDKLPDSFPCDQVVGEVTAEAAERTGLKKGTPVVAGTVDANAAYVAGGVISPGEISITMGTAGCMGVIHDKPSFTKNMITIAHTVDSRNMYSTLGCIVSCGALTRFFRDQFGQEEKRFAKELGLDVYDIMNMEAATAPAGSDGLITLPYFMGERTPIWDPVARGVMFGMSLAHTRGHMIRSFMEAAAYALYQNYLYIKQSGLEIKLPMVLVEGGAKSELWRQIMADVFDVPVAYTAESKGAPVGNAINAGVGVGVFKDYSMVKDWIKVSNYHEPNPKAHAQYMQYFEIYDRLYGKLKDEYQALAKATGYK